MSHRLERVTLSCPELPPASKPGADGAVPTHVGICVPQGGCAEPALRVGGFGVPSSAWAPLCASVIKACRPTLNEVKGKE